jgi:Tfp pilus assembly protein PilP
MKSSLLVLVLLLVGCNETSSRVLTYDELVNYPSQCSKVDSQLRELKEIQRIKNFDQDPDKLNPADRAYNSRLKASIWWYAYRCNQS